MTLRTLSRFGAALLFSLYALPVEAQTVLSSQNFDAFPQCFTQCGAACVLPAASGWTNLTTDDRDWIVDAGGTGSNGTGPGADHTLGTPAGRYMYTEASQQCANDTAEVASPIVPLTGTNAPVVRFWYHMFGTSMGQLHVDVIHDPAGMNPVVTTDAIPPLSDNVNAWQLSNCVPLDPMAPAAQVVFRGVTGPSFSSDMAIDDVEFVDLTGPDLAVTAIRRSNNCVGTTTIEADVQNQGSGAATFTISYAVNGGMPVTETVNAGVPLCGSVTHAFTVPANLAVGTSSITVSVLAAGDTNAANDTRTAVVDVKPIVSAFPYAEDFEAGPGGWTTGGTPLWELGAPTDGTIDSAESGVNAWVTDLDANYPNNAFATLESVCFDGSGLVNPRFEASLWREAEFSWDGAQLQVSTDGGNTWDLVGALNDPVNWYNDGTILGLAPSGSQVGWTGRNNTGNGSGGWERVERNLDNNTAGNVFQLRIVFGSDTAVTDDGIGFDSVTIVDNPPQLEITDATVPNAGAFPAGTANIVVQSLLLDNSGNTADINSLTLDKLGTIPDAALTGIRLYLDDGDGIPEPTTDDTLLSASTVTMGQATFNFMPSVSIPADAAALVHVAVDLGLTVMGGETFGTTVTSTTNVTLAGTHPVVLPDGPADSPLSSTFQSIDILPFADAFDVGTPTNRRVVVTPAIYPTATATGTTIVPSAPSTNAALATVTGPLPIPGIGNFAPNSDPFMMVLAFPNGAATAAVDYYFDLSSYDVNTDDVYVFASWNNVRQTDDAEDNIFVSLDGGTTWALSAYNWDFTTPVPAGWERAIVDLSAAMRAANLTFTNNMVIRYQAAGDPTSALALDDMWTGIPQALRLERLAGMPITSGAIDFLGNVPGGMPVPLGYTFYNDGQGDLVVDFPNAMITGVNASLVNTPTVAITIPPGGSATPAIDILIPAMGGFQVDALIPTNDPRIGGPFSLRMRGVGAFEPEIEVTAGGAPVANGGTHSFGTTSVGTMLSIDYGVTNLGGLPLVLTGTPTAELRNATNVTTTTVGMPGRSVAAGQTETFAVAFSPTAAGAFSYEIVIENNDADEGTYVVTATGTAIAPEIAVNRGGNDIPAGGQDDLGRIEPGVGQTLTYTIDNLGTADLALLGTPIVDVSGANNVTASVTMQPATATVAAGGSTTFTVDVSADAAGAFSVDLLIPNNDPDEGGFTVSIVGEGFIPAADLEISRGGTPVANGGTDNAGNSMPGSPQVFTYTLTNSGTLDLTLNGNARIENAMNAEATITTQPAMTIAPAASETMEVSFSAQAAGAFSFQVVVESNDPAEPTYTITVSGMGDGEAPEITVEQPAGTAVASGGSINLGAIKVGAAQTLAFTIRNEGAGDLVLTATPPVALGGAMNATANVTMQPTTPIAAGATSTFEISITPDAAGAFSTVVSITSNDGDESEYTITVSGTGDAGGGGGGGRTEDGGCSCEATERHDRPVSVFALFAVGALLFVRRRR